MDIITNAGLIVPESAVDLPQTWKRETFPRINSASDDELLTSLSEFRDKSRQLDKTECLARAATENFVTNVVSDGLRLQSKIDHRFIGIPEADAREFERKIEKIFELHTGTQEFDFRRVQTFAQMQATIMRAVLIDGDCLAVRRFKPRRSAVLGTTVQLISGDRLRSPLRGYVDADVREGVELDEDGQPMAYHVLNRKGPQSLEIETLRIPRYDDNDIPLALLIHSSRLPGQSRGEPFLAPVVDRFRQLERYTDAEIRASVLNAFYAAFITTETPEIDQRRMSALPAQLRPSETRIQRKFGPEGGLMMELLKGEKVDTSAPGRPNANFEPFVQAVVKMISIGLGLPPEVLTQHFQSSYSAARGAILEAWKAYKIRRSWLVSEFCQPVYEWIVTESVLAGMLNAPGFEDPFKRRLYMATEWIGSTMSSIDPLKDARADEVKITRNMTESRRSVVERDGRDFEKLKREIDDERNYFNQKSTAVVEANGNTKP
jgi:lambda family phage portal protein